MTVDEKRFLALWTTRTTLERGEVAELYLAAQAALLPTGRRNGKIKSLVDALPYDLEDYVADFLQFKIFESPGGDTLNHINVLAEYFYRFLVSRQRKEHIPGNIGTGGEEGEDAGGSPLSEVLGHGCHEIDPAEILVNALTDPGQVADQALAFLRDCPVWARLFLRFHDCADPEDGKTTRSKLAADFKIPSYQQNAWKLGVVVPLTSVGF